MNIIEKRKQMRGQGGFTLIELLVVVAILAILAGVAVFAVNNLTKDAGNSACKTERSTLQTAMAAARATTSSTDGPADYLENGTLKYFAAASPTSGGATTRYSANRTNTSDVASDTFANDGCPSVTNF